MDAVYTRRGFLPEPDPLESFAEGSELAVLDDIGRTLPERLKDPCFRRWACSLRLPVSKQPLPLAEQRLYYVRVGALAAAYIGQQGQLRATVLPRSIAVPLAQACSLLGRPPVLGPDGYVLYNWKRRDPNGPIALGNLDALQTFTDLEDERWFILAHVEMESIAAEILAAIGNGGRAAKEADVPRLDASLRCIEEAVLRQAAVIRRIPERTDPRLFYRLFRPYVRPADSVIYEGVHSTPLRHFGEAQSSVLPALTAFLKLPSRPLAGCIAGHPALLEEIDGLPPVAGLASPAAFGGVVEAIARFSEAQYAWATQYLRACSGDARRPDSGDADGLRQFIDQTRNWRTPRTLHA